MNKKIGSSAKILILSDIIYTITGIFLNTFLIAYFLHITNESMLKISIYYIIIHFISMIGKCITGKIIKKYPSQGKFCLFVGIIIRGLFIMLIVLLLDKIVSYYILIAILYAISESFYWCSHELIYFNVTNNYNRKKYMTTNRITEQLVKIIVPIILGTSIELYSFNTIAIYVFFLSIVQIALILFINVDFKNKNESKYSYRKFLNYLKINNLTKVKIYGISAITYGIVESSISTIIVIITIMTFKTSFNLGVLTTIFAFCSMISLLIYNKIYNKNNSKFILVILSIIVVCGVLGLLIDINKVTLIIYNFCYMITFCIFDALYNMRKANLVYECQLENYKEEYIGYTSVLIGIGRIIGYSLMLIVSFTSNILYFKILLMVVTLFAPLYCYLMYKSQ